MSPSKLLLFLAGTALFYLWLIKANRQSFWSKSQKPVNVEVAEQGISYLRDGGRNLILWSNFGRCLESTVMFVLLDRPERMVFMFPKRAFLDEEAQNSFRSLVRQMTEREVTPPSTPIGPDTQPATGEIRMEFELGFTDYLVLTLSSWRTRGVVLGMYALITVICLLQSLHPSKDDVNSMSKVYFEFMLPIFTVMMTIITLLWSLLAWRSNSEHTQLKLLLKEGGAEFFHQHGTGAIAWTANTHYLENWHGFILWDRSARIWLMLPKRVFVGESEIEQCRSLLRTHLSKSPWFV